MPPVPKSTGRLPIVTFLLVAYLALVAVVELAGDRAEEDARVEVLAVGEHVELQHEVAVLAFALQGSGPFFTLISPCVGDRELRSFVGSHSTTFQPPRSLPLKMVVRSERLELDVLELDLAAVELQADVPASRPASDRCSRAPARPSSLTVEHGPCRP